MAWFRTDTEQPNLVRLVPEADVLRFYYRRRERNRLIATTPISRTPEQAPS
jgi:hypothetical protein